MSKFPTYPIHNLDDFRNVPVERRAECMVEFLACLIEADKLDRGITLARFTWTDDGERGLTLKIRE